MTETLPVVVIGCGNIGTALLHTYGGKRNGIRVVAGFDINPQILAPQAEVPILESLDRSLAHIETVTSRMAGPRGMMEGLTGNADSAARLLRSLDQLNALTLTLNGTARRLDRLLASADAKVLGRDGLTDEARKAIVHADAVLADLRTSVGKLDAGLENARQATGDIKAISASAREATSDLVALRAEVDASLAKTHQLLRDLNRKWPFARDPALTLP
jgi:phospholipid/cholesterol/gamma-HCH transport system substrate-binding protein